MEVLLSLGLALLVWGIGKLIEFFQGDRTSSPPVRPSPSRRASVPKSPNTFRPVARNRTPSGIHFKESSPFGTSSSVSIFPDELAGLHDAFTGAPLDKNLGLYQCQSCKVFYHHESVQVLKEVNNSQCVSCQSTNILSLVSSAATSGGKDYTPNVVTLSNYRKHLGSVVTFEGRVHAVKESRRGNDFAVMFENKSWVEGFKLVFFRGTVKKVGGQKFISSLIGKTVTVRGLIVQHERFGYEIIISEKSMILSVN